MPRSLLLLVGSALPGAYINTLAYAVEQLKVEQIVMVNILYAPLGEANAFEDLVNRDLQITLSELAKGTYESKKIPFGKIKLYEEIYDRYEYRHIERINYHFLRKEIRRMRNAYGEESIVDITSLPKRVAIDVLTASLAENISHVMLFELKKQGRYLYHELESNDYEYIPELILQEEGPALTLFARSLLLDHICLSHKSDRQHARTCYLARSLTEWVPRGVVRLATSGSARAYPAGPDLLS